MHIHRCVNLSVVTCSLVVLLTNPTFPFYCAPRIMCHLPLHFFGLVQGRATYPNIYGTVNIICVAYN